MLLLAFARRQPQSFQPIAAGPGLFVTSLVGAAVTGWAAVGVGEVVAAWLMIRQRTDAQRAIGFGVVLLALTSIALAVIHWFWLGGLPWSLACFVILGAVFGARVGPFVARWVAPAALKLGFAVVAILDGLLMISRS